MQSVISFVVANKAAVALAVYAILDLVILINPSASGNGLLHQVLLWAQSISGQQPPSAPPAA